MAPAGSASPTGSVGLSSNPCDRDPRHGRVRDGLRISKEPILVAPENGGSLRVHGRGLWRLSAGHAPAPLRVPGGPGERGRDHGGAPLGGAKKAIPWGGPGASPVASRTGPRTQALPRLG